MTTLDYQNEMHRVGVIILSNGGGFAVVDEDRVAELNQRSWSNTRGYAGSGVRLGKKSISLLMHRMIFGAEKGKSVDHRNGEKLDNRIGNLRYATKSQNAANSKKRNLGKTASIYKGVDWDKGAWSVHIKRIYVGRFPSEIEAAKAYNAAALEHFGEYARLNAIP